VRYRRGCEQGGEIDGCAGALLLDQESGLFFGGRLQTGFVLASQFGQGAQVLDDGGLEMLFEEWQKRRANPGARFGGVPIGGVFAPRLFAGPEVGTEIGTPGVQEWADNRAGSGVNAGETGESGSSKKVSQDGFGLIVGGVSDGDRREVFFLGQLREKLVARPTGGVFQIGFLAFGFGGDVIAADMELQAVASGKFGDEVFVGVGGFAAKLVIEVEDSEDDSQFFAQLDQQQEQRDGVRTTRNGDADASAGTKRPQVGNAAAEGSEQAVEESRLLEAGRGGFGISFFHASKPMVSKPLVRERES
jgi:hypothetical protein